jgi:hypothetical protein
MTACALPVLVALAAAAAAPARIVVDPTSVSQVVRGFGGQADYQILGSPGRADGVTRDEYEGVIRECVANGMTWARVGLPAWEDRNDDADPVTANRAYFEEQFAYHYPGLVEHLKHLKSVGIEPLIVFWGFPGWMYGRDGKLKDGVLPEVVENCAVLLEMLREKGASVRYFTIVNEPPWGATIGDPATFAGAACLLGRRIEELGLGVTIVAPDLAGDILRLAPEWVDPLLVEAQPEVHMIALHGYQFSLDAKPEQMVPFHAALRREMAGRGAGGETPEIWYTEYNGHWFGNADNDRRAFGGPCDSWAHGMKVAEMTHWLLRSGVSLAMLWEMYDVRRAVEEDKPKRWGMIKYRTEKWAKRPEYFTLGMYSRFILPGYRIIGCRDISRKPGEGPLALAALGPDEIVVVVANLKDSDDAAELAIAANPARPAEIIQTTEAVPFSRFFRPIRQGLVYLDLPPRSVATVRVPIRAAGP